MLMWWKLKMSGNRTQEIRAPFRCDSLSCIRGVGTIPFVSSPPLSLKDWNPKGNWLPFPLHHLNWQWRRSAPEPLSPGLLSSLKIEEFRRRKTSLPSATEGKFLEAGVRHDLHLYTYFPAMRLPISRYWIHFFLMYKLSKMCVLVRNVFRR